MVLIRSRRRKRKNILKSRRQGFWNQHLLIEQLASGAFTN